MLKAIALSDCAAFLLQGTCHAADSAENTAFDSPKFSTAPATPTPDFQSLRIKGITIALPGPQDTIDPDFAGIRSSLAALGIGYIGYSSNSFFDNMLPAERTTFGQQVYNGQKPTFFTNNVMQILTTSADTEFPMGRWCPDIIELKDIVNDILHDDRRATEVIRRMRSLLQKAPFEPKNLDLNDLARETVDFLSSLAVARKVELTNLITQKALPILGDRIQLQQVILNLVVNGIDAMKDTPTEDRIISIRTSRVEEFAELSVLDRGLGIPEDKLEAVFEPFYTSKAEGMGMGLSIARTIIEAHHGLMWAENRDHGGASFQIRLPLVGGG